MDKKGGFRLATPSLNALSATLAPTELAICDKLVGLGNTAPTDKSLLVTSFARRSAAARNMPGVTDVAFAARVPRAMPGKMNALFAKPGLNCGVFASTGNFVPEAKTTLPFVFSYASFAVHSDFEVGFDNENTIGRLFNFAISFKTGFENAFACAAAPINAVGLHFCTASSNSEASNNALSSLRAKRFFSIDKSSKSFLDVVTTPLLSNNQTCFMASSSLTPRDFNARTNKSAAPVFACPAPKNKTRCCSKGRTSSTRVDAIKPETVTAAVP